MDQLETELKQWTWSGAIYETILKTIIQKKKFRKFLKPV